MPLTNIAVTTTSHGPVGSGRNVLAYDLTTAALVASCELPHPPQSLLYRPNYDDFLVATTGADDGGQLHRIDRAFTLLASTPLALPPGPGSDLWRIQVVRSDLHGGLYVAYQPGVGTALGDQLLRQVHPVTFATLAEWRTFLPPDDRNFQGGDFSRDGAAFVFAMFGGEGLNQHVIYQLHLGTGLATPFTSYGTWSGGLHPTGNTYDARFLRPQADGGYVAATMYLSGTDHNTRNDLLLITAAGAVTAAYPLDPTLPAGVNLYGVIGLAVEGPMAWFVTGNGILARMDLTTGVQTTLAETGYGFADLVVLLGDAGTAPPYGPPETATDQRAIRRLRRAPHVNHDNTRVFVRRFELDLERGQGLATGQGSDPIVLLRVSRDGGQTWGEEIRMQAGALGAYTQRVLARRLGHGRDTVFEVTVSDPIAWSLVGAWLDLEGGTS